MFGVHIVEGEVAKFQADVLVNSTTRDLTLHRGGLSRSLLKAAGQGLQDECSRVYPNGISLGQLAVTGGYGLKCKQVYHGCLPSWPFGSGEFPEGISFLCQFVCTCLARAHEDKVTSVAFPALGTGFLGYPAHISAQTIFQCLAMFQSLHSRTPIVNVSIVIYTQGRDWQHVKAAFQRALTGSDQSAPMLEESMHTARPSKRFSETVILPKTSNSCDKTLKCGHPCCGYKDERSCLPCIQKRCSPSTQQHAGDSCVICYTDELAAAPVVMLTCGHLFHLHCAQRMLENKWVGTRITFTFSLCPMCKASIHHPKLAPLLDPIRQLQGDVNRKALTRLQYEGLDKSGAITKRGGEFYKDPQGFAMNRYCYYQCFKCKTAYFGGTAQCQQQAEDDDDAINFKPEELICSGCSGVKRDQVCVKHGTDYLEYKCCFCCSIAVFFCFGKIHFCKMCHDNHNKVMFMKQWPPCPAGPVGKKLPGNKCPLNIRHPPNGQEFALGCGICANAQLF